MPKPSFSDVLKRADVILARAETLMARKDVHVETVSVKETKDGRWYVTFDGNIPGDSRGRDKAAAIAEAKGFVSREEGYAKRDGRTPTLRYKAP